MEAYAHQRYPVSRKNSEESDKIHSWPRPITANLQGKTRQTKSTPSHVPSRTGWHHVLRKNRSPRFNISDYVTPTTGYTRSSVNHSLNHTYSRTNNLRHFYYNRLPRLWNSLPPMDMNLTSSTIKATLKNLLWQHFLCNFESDAPCTFHFKCPCNKCSKMHI